MGWRNEWNDGDAGPRGPGWRATLAATPITSAVFLGAIFVWLLGTLHAAGAVPFSVNRWLWLSLDNAPFVYPFFTHVLPHDPTSLFHLVFNMLGLWFFGRELEMRLGRGSFATLFFGAALCGAIAHLVVMAVRREPTGLVGASGGLMGLLFFMARETPDRPFLFYFFRVPFKVLAILLVAFDLHPLLLGRKDGVAHLCHLGGAAFGFTWFRWRFDALSWWAALRDQSRAAKAERLSDRERDDDAEMDRLLAKIHAEGMPSLTQRERSFLQQRSESAKRGRR
ncbi:MAG: rhomboid family intramembrane serine protease [Planctomycetes bacterium]|nr:rhomboid family intramembrane serine protease [Planctomycetota bacterium]